MNYPDSYSAFLAGAGHAFYALIGVMAVAVAINFFPKDARWSILIFGLSAAVFADLWAHGYTH